MEIGSLLKQALLALPLSYPRQIHWDTWMPMQPVTLSTTVTTGVIAAYYDLYVGNIPNYSRFDSLFREYRFVEAKFETRCFSTSNSGLFAAFVDEKVATLAPTINEAIEKKIIDFPCSDVFGKHLIHWKATDLLDLEFTDTSVSTTIPVTFKLYTDNSSFGSSIVATPYCEIVPWCRIQFRELIA